MIYPPAYIGDFSAERVAQLAFVPQEAASGTNVRSLRLVAGEDLVPDRHNYWLLEVGILDANGLRRLAQRPLDDGFSAGVQRIVTFTDPILVPRGSTLACRLTPRGSPPPISGLSAVVEFGILSTNRAAR